ncbi:hypothetical protein V6N13_064710 [Hibiscus sabdariffa]|uniref:Secreted protein n=1 Tax=Hibiscus sabdariffa TaxID=183260 RepID=A0ABR2EAV4_9ROSI
MFASSLSVLSPRPLGSTTGYPNHPRWLFGVLTLGLKCLALFGASGFCTGRPSFAIDAFYSSCFYGLVPLVSRSFWPFVCASFVLP